MALIMHRGSLLWLDGEAASGLEPALVLLPGLQLRPVAPLAAGGSPSLDPLHSFRSFFAACCEVLGGCLFFKGGFGVFSFFFFKLKSSLNGGRSLQESTLSSPRKQPGFAYRYFFNALISLMYVNVAGRTVRLKLTSMDVTSLLNLEREAGDDEEGRKGRQKAGWLAGWEGGREG